MVAWLPWLAGAGVVHGVRRGVPAVYKKIVQDEADYNAGCPMDAKYNPKTESCECPGWKVFDEETRTCRNQVYCGREGSQKYIFFLWACVLAVVFVFMSYRTYTKASIRKAQKKGCDTKKFVEPERERDWWAFFVGLLLVVILVIFTYAMYSCKELTTSERVGGWVGEKANKVLGYIPKPEINFDVKFKKGGFAKKKGWFGF